MIMAPVYDKQQHTQSVDKVWKSYKASWSENEGLEV